MWVPVVWLGLFEQILAMGPGFIHGHKPAFLKDNRQTDRKKEQREGGREGGRKGGRKRTISNKISGRQLVFNPTILN